MLAPKRDEFLVVAVLGSAVVDHLHVCNQTAKNTMRTGSCSCSPKTFQRTATFHPPIPPLWGNHGCQKLCNAYGNQCCASARAYMPAHQAICNSNSS